MDPLATLKEITGIVKKYNDLELMKQIVDLQTEVFELQQENLTLKQKVASLDQRAKQQDELRMEGPNNYYFREGDDVPYCPKCYEKDGKLIHLPAAEEWNGGIRRVCVVCNESFYEKPIPPQPPFRIGRMVRR